MIRTVSPLLALTLSVLLPACAPQGNFPSLAPRAVEKLPDEEPERPLPPPVPTDPALIARVADLIERARLGQRDFEAAEPTTRSAVGRAGASGSESWVEAQLAVSRLQAARLETTDALASLNEIAVERANKPTNPDDFRTIVAAIETVSGLSDAQGLVISQLEAELTR